MAQSVEQLIRNQQVMGSSPIISSKISDSHRRFFVFTEREKTKNIQCAAFRRIFFYYISFKTEMQQKAQNKIVGREKFSSVPMKRGRKNEWYFKF